MRLVAGFPTRRPGFEHRSCGICGGQSDTGAGFLRVLRFLLPILIPPTAPHSSSIIRGWFHRPNGGRRTKWTQSYPTQRNLKRGMELSSSCGRDILHLLWAPKVHYRVHKDAVYLLPLATTLPVLSGIIKAVVATVTIELLNKCRLKQNTPMTSTGPLMVSSPNICKMHLTNLDHITY
jgi:hypothetical protein